MYDTVTTNKGRTTKVRPNEKLYFLFIFVSAYIICFWVIHRCLAKLFYGFQNAHPFDTKAHRGGGGGGLLGICFFNPETDHLPTAQKCPLTTFVCGKHVTGWAFCDL